MTHPSNTRTPSYPSNNSGRDAPEEEFFDFEKDQLICDHNVKEFAEQGTFIVHD